VTTTPAWSEGRRRPGDTVFRWSTTAGGLLVLALLGAITTFLVVRSIPALTANQGSFLTTQEWNPDGTQVFGIAALLFGTVLSSTIALALALPVAVGTAVFVTQYAPRRIGTALGWTVDLLAAVPSVVYGLWGYFFLLPRLVPVQELLSGSFGWIPLFADPDGQAATFSKSVFAASVVLAIMIVPIISAISREVMTQADAGHREAALALGATRWEAIRIAVLAPSRPGLVSAAMLGLGRALGETIAVAIVIGSSFGISWHVLVPGGNTIAANIANKFGEAGATGRSALIASGLVLFLLTFVVNLVARIVISRTGGRERSAAG
jgi:phosphate transport system permease protein